MIRIEEIPLRFAFSFQKNKTESLSFILVKKKILMVLRKMHIFKSMANDLSFLRYYSIKCSKYFPY